MFESLQEGLSSALKTLRGKGKLTESNMRDGLALAEKALLEADVSYSVVKDFIARVSEKALGERVLGSLDPSQQLIGIVHQELVDLMGPVDHSMHLQAGVANGTLVEHHYLAVELYRQIYRGLPEPADGYFTMSDKPGLGFEPDRDDSAL